MANSHTKSVKCADQWKRFKQTKINFVSRRKNGGYKPSSLHGRLIVVVRPSSRHIKVFKKFKV